MNYEERNIMITELAKEAAEDAKLESSYYGKKVTPEAIYVAIDCAFAMNGITFKNDSAKSMMETVILKEISNVSPKVYAEAWPPVYYDVNGNMTFDERKAA